MGNSVDGNCFALFDCSPAKEIRETNLENKCSFTIRCLSKWLSSIMLQILKKTHTHTNERMRIAICLSCIHMLRPCICTSTIKYYKILINYIYIASTKYPSTVEESFFPLVADICTLYMFPP